MRWVLKRLDIFRREGSEHFLSAYPMPGAMLVVHSGSQGVSVFTNINKVVD